MRSVPGRVRLVAIPMPPPERCTKRGIVESKRVAVFVQPRVGLAPGQAPVGADGEVRAVGEKDASAFEAQKGVSSELSVVEGQHLFRSRHRHVAHVRPLFECLLLLSPANTVHLPGQNYWWQPFTPADGLSSVFSRCSLQCEKRFLRPRIPGKFPDSAGVIRWPWPKRQLT